MAVERTFSSQNKQIFWEIGRRCNYDCSYCHPYVHNNFEEHKSLEKLKYATERLEKFSRGEKISFAISGGEPTLNPDYLTWANFLADKGHKLSTHSNGSRAPEYYQELIKVSDLNISVHFEFYQKEKMLELLMILSKTVHERREAGESCGHLEVMLMMKPGMRNTMVEFEKNLWEIPFFRHTCTLTLMPIRGHESIDGEDRTGDILLKEYEEIETKNFGARSPSRFLEDENSSADADLRAYDSLDEIKDEAERKSKFEVISKKLSGLS
jgi:organic radical activating enzyme